MYKEPQHCTKCNTPMVEGVALAPNFKDKGKTFGWRVGELVLFAASSSGAVSKCLKCPKCGNSITV